jgi:hypothetical protein
MGRILVLLTFACLIAAFVIIYKTGNLPVQSGIIKNSNVSTQGNGNTRATKHSQIDKTNRAARTGRVADRRRKTISKSTTDQLEASVPESLIKATAESGDDPRITVKSDSTPVYAANTKQSKVLRRLRKGERVRPDVEIIDQEGRWRVVKGREKEKPGFVRDEQIERTPRNP